MQTRNVTQVPAVSRLRLWLVGDRTQAWLARKLGVSRPTVYRWCQGENAPDPVRRRQIQDISGGFIHQDDWFTGDELADAYGFCRTAWRRLKRRQELKEGENEEV